MPRVICNLPNASDEINGVKFYPLDDGGVVSDEVSEEVAAHFLSINGYESWDKPAPAGALAADPVKPAAPPPPKTRKAAAKKAEEPKAPEAPPVPPAPELEVAQAPQEPQDGQDAAAGGEDTTEVF